MSLGARLPPMGLNRKGAGMGRQGGQSRSSQVKNVEARAMIFRISIK